jgi:hypothetical protein
VLLTLRFAQADAGSSTILRDELDAGYLQDALNGFEIIRHRNRPPSFEISNCTFAYLRFDGYEKRAAGRRDRSVRKLMKIKQALKIRQRTKFKV